MANIRSIKKDIHFLTDEVVSDCYVYIYLNPGKKTEAAEKIALESEAFRNAAIDKVNNPGKFENAKLRKAYFKGLYEELITEVNKQFEQLSALSKN
ncbi:hypothetical protein [Williamwhitmania taraxaci]|uniref:Uncharacterized protein n=1 Tax=Williamwhitmania taraxaci TaxID=1640674 RepID=A0A1G6H2J5_9BACT|nr:hypothetical protein [Williamwhitmania taraxaci]SDB88374.1 hypothetical protein SAMN05216323_100628 [Williamwhitmania taraxaci]